MSLAYRAQVIIDGAAKRGLLCFRCKFTTKDGREHKWIRFGKSHEYVRTVLLEILICEFYGFSDLSITQIFKMDDEPQTEKEEGKE